MATIDAAIVADQAPAQPEIVENPYAAPLAPPPPDISDKDVVQATREADKRQAEIDKARENLLGEEEAAKVKAEEQAKANRPMTVRAAEATIDNAKRIARKADMSVGSLPMPGSIAVPLILLLLLFFVLIQVAGNSRLAWLWLVLTGNAQVAGGSSSSSVQTLPVSQPTSLVQTPVTTLASTLSPLVVHTVWSGSGMIGGLY